MLTQKETLELTDRTQKSSTVLFLPFWYLMSNLLVAQETKTAVVCCAEASTLLKKSTSS